MKNQYNFHTVSNELACQQVQVKQRCKVKQRNDCHWLHHLKKSIRFFIKKYFTLNSFDIVDVNQRNSSIFSVLIEAVVSEIHFKNYVIGIFNKIHVLLYFNCTCICFFVNVPQILKI